MRSVLAFSMHQFVSTFAIFFTAPVALAVFADSVRPLGWILSTEQTSHVLTRTPYFPVHIVLGLFAGWALARAFPSKSMYRVWILPFATLVLAFESYPAIQPFVIGQKAYLTAPSSISHFFGRGCEIRKLCFDQMYLTMPFYAASAYSLGSWLAQRFHVVSGSQEPVRTINPWRAFLVSSLVWLFVMLDSLSSVSGLGSAPLGVKVAIVSAVTVVFAAATTLLTVIGSGLIGKREKRER
jgi:hypothetical protein